LSDPQKTCDMLVSCDYREETVMLDLGDYMHPKESAYDLKIDEIYLDGEPVEEEPLRSLLLARLRWKIER